MSDLTNNIYVQPLLVDSESGSVPANLDDAGNYATVSYLDSGTSQRFAFAPDQIVQRTFSNVPVVFPSELVSEYRELGQALCELSEISEVDEWGIEPPVYAAAKFVAAALMVNLYPAPRVFNHGPQSIVFNWESAVRNLYLTISADKISALISSPERIERRMEINYSDFLDPHRLVGSVREPQLEHAVRRLPGGTSDLPEFQLMAP